MAKAYSVKMLAAKWDCSTKFIYGLINDGRLKAFSISQDAKSPRARGIRITEEAIKAFTEQCTQDVQSEDGVPGVVYFADCGRFTKIGFTSEKNWQRRINGIQSSNPFPVKAWAIIGGSFSSERQIHALLDRYRHSLEWFELGEVGRRAAEHIIKTRGGQFLERSDG